MSHSNQTGRYARTMAQINPYMSGPVHPMPEPKTRHWQDVALYLAGVLAVLVVAIVGQV